jgi:hypothetical protein
MQMQYLSLKVTAQPCLKGVVRTHIPNLPTSAGRFSTNTMKSRSTGDLICFDGKDADYVLKGVPGPTGVLSSLPSFLDRFRLIRVLKYSPCFGLHYSGVDLTFSIAVWIRFWTKCVSVTKVEPFFGGITVSSLTCAILKQRENRDHT